MQASPRGRKAPLPVALVACLSVVVAACGGGGSTSTGAAAGGGQTGPVECGPGNGQEATETPIKLGAIMTKQPGTDFTEISSMAQAYFECVNDNGGVNGHPIEYIVETEQTDPGQVASLAKKLIESDQVLGLVGNTSIIGCAVNHEYFEEQGIFVIGSGIAPECWNNPNTATVNLGPRFGIDGTMQYVIRQGPEKIVLDQARVPGAEWIAEGSTLIAKDAGVPIVTLTEAVPIQDANSIALKLVQAAGDGGAVVLNFTPPEALKILQAAQRQGLQDRVIWACGTTCNTDFLAEALGPQWDGKLGINAELALYDAKGEDLDLYRAVREKYAPDIPLGSFSQMGFLAAKIAVDALATIEGDYTVESVNEAFVNVENYETDMLCEPWYYGEAPLHIPNNTAITVTPQGDHMVPKEPCFEISAADPLIAQVREIEKENPELVGK